VGSPPFREDELEVFAAIRRVVLLLLGMFDRLSSNGCEKVLLFLSISGARALFSFLLAFISHRFFPKLSGLRYPEASI